MADPLAGLTFSTREDEWSFQAACDQHPNFWFRLEREGDDQDLITDFMLRPRGAFPDDPDLSFMGGALLKKCYRLFGLVPRTRIVFGDILASNVPPDPSPALSAAQSLYTRCASELFTAYGFNVSGTFVERRVVDKPGVRLRTDKYDLIIHAVPD